MAYMSHNVNSFKGGALGEYCSGYSRGYWEFGLL